MLTENSRLIKRLSRIFGIFTQQQAISFRYCSTALVEKPEENAEKSENSKNFEKFRFRYPEFLPDPNLNYRNPVKEKLERREMLRRRNVISIPEFYVGSILAVTTSDRHANGKSTRFVGICIHRENRGLASSFLLRNVIENLGVEVRYLLYSPVIRKIEVLRLEKRLDEELFYLRDAPLEYSTFPFDMAAQFTLDKEVPINTLKVPLNPRPWHLRYERMDLKGAILPEISEKLKRKAAQVTKPWEKYDLMDEYRRSIHEEEQSDIFNEVCEMLNELEKKQKVEKRKKAFERPKTKGPF